MCCEANRRDRCCCERPERLRNNPQECTPEQVRECHGEENEHSCAAKEKPE